VLPAQVIAIAAAAALLFLMLARAGIPLAPRLVALSLFLAIMLSMRHSDARFLYRWRALELTAGMAALLGIGAMIIRPQPGDGPLPWRVWARRHWPALAGYAALTAAMLFPLLPRLSTAIPGGPGDALEYLWKLQLFSDYLIGRHQTPISLPWLMYPEGFELAISRLSGRRYYLGATAVGLALIVELAAAVPNFVTGTPRPVDIWLRTQPGYGAVIEFPYRIYGFYVYNAYVTGKPSNMWYGTFDPPLYSENVDALRSFPSNDAIAILRRWQTEYIVINEQQLGRSRSDWASAIARYPQLRLVYAQRGYSVYRVPIQSP
jgi:hypothetical protein